jgi:c-di-GMP-binding flagellar brake protein YcgR
MDDALFMGGFDRLANALCDIKCFFNRNRPPYDALRQRFTSDEFHHEELPSTGFLNSVNRRNAWMIQRRQYTRFSLESGRPVSVVTEGFGKKFDRNTTTEFRVSGLIDVTHASRTEMARDFVMCEFASDHGCK